MIHHSLWLAFLKDNSGDEASAEIELREFIHAQVDLARLLLCRPIIRPRLEISIVEIEIEKNGALYRTSSVYGRVPRPTRYYVHSNSLLTVSQFKIVKKKPTFAWQQTLKIYHAENPATHPYWQR